jgi:hypothetical protein
MVGLYCNSQNHSYNNNLCNAIAKRKKRSKDVIIISLVGSQANHEITNKQVEDVYSSCRKYLETNSEYDFIQSWDEMISPQMLCALESHFQLQTQEL